MLQTAASTGCDAHGAGPEASTQALLTQSGSQQPIRVACVPGADLPRRARASSLECSSQGQTPQAGPAAAVKAPGLRDGLPTVPAQYASTPAGQVSAAGAVIAAGQALGVSAARQAEQGSLPVSSQAGAAEAAPADPEQSAQGAAAEPAGTGKAAQLLPGLQQGAGPREGEADLANRVDAATWSAQRPRAASAGRAAPPVPAGTKSSPPASEGEAAETGPRQNPTGAAAAGAAAVAAVGPLRPAEMPAEDGGGGEAPAQRQAVESSAALASPANVADAEPLLQAGGTDQPVPTCKSQLEFQASAAAGAGPRLAGGGTTNAGEPGPLLMAKVLAADARATSFMLVPQTSKPAAQAGGTLAVPAKYSQGEPLLVGKHVLQDVSCMICPCLMCQQQLLLQLPQPQMSLMPAGVAQLGSRLSPALGQGLRPLLLCDALKQRRSEQLPKQAAPARQGTDSGGLQQGHRAIEAEQSRSVAVSTGQ